LNLLVTFLFKQKSNRGLSLITALTSNPLPRERHFLAQILRQAQDDRTKNLKITSA
jgi:hypothetical protein